TCYKVISIKNIKMYELIRNTLISVLKLMKFHLWLVTEETSWNDWSKEVELVQTIITTVVFVEVVQSLEIHGLIRKERIKSASTQILRMHCFYEYGARIQW